MSELVFIAVPGGRSGPAATDPATLRVVISPRLDGGKLSDHNMEHWPPRELASPALSVDFASAVGATPLSPPVAITTVRIQPQRELWEAFFGGTDVTPPPRGASAPPVVVDPTGRRAADIMATFREVVTKDLAHLDDTARHELLTRWAAAVEPPRPPARTLAETPPFVPPDFHRTLAL